MMADAGDGQGGNSTAIASTQAPGFVDNRNLVGVVLYATGLTIGMTFSVLGNALTLVAIALHRTLRTKTYCLLASLAAADMLNGGTTFPLMLAATIHGRWPFSDRMCSLLGSLTILFCCASINTLVFVSIDRYIAIVDPLRYVTKVTSTFVTICLVYSWVEAVWIATMPMAGWSHYEYIPIEYICTVDWASISYTLFLIGYNIFLPVLIIIFCYAQIFRVARDQSRKVAAQTVQVNGGGGDGGKAKGERKAAKILFIVIGTFLTCWTPHTVTMLCNAFTQNQCPIPDAYHTMTVILAHTNSAMNPILYGALNRQMRRAYLNVLTYIFRRSQNRGVDFSLAEYSM